MIRYRLAQALKDENRKTRKRMLKVALVVIGAVWLAVNLTCAYPILGWHPHACLCAQCEAQYYAEWELDHAEGLQR